MTASANTAFAALRRLTTSRPRAEPAPVEHCDLCSVSIPPIHRHLLELPARKIVCSCDACALRFQGVIGGRFRLIPRDPRPIPGMQLSDADWEGLALPINLAFFFHSTPAGKMIALYPGPAGATESLLPLETWAVLTAANPVLGTMEADVEALLVNRVEKGRDYLIVPIDACFELAGLIVTHWRGLSGGDLVWEKIAEFFARLKAIANHA